MGEPPTDDVASALIGKLEADADLVDAGHFTLDVDEARDKLASYQLAEPERFVLLLVEAAHLLPDCTSIGFEIGGRGTRVRLAGVNLAESELRGLLDPLFVDDHALEGDAARRMRGRQRLALAVNTMLKLADDDVELRSHRIGEGQLRLSFAGGRATIESEDDSSSLPVLELALRPTDSSVAEAQRALLRSEARHSTVPLTLDGERVDIGLTHPDMAAPVGAPSELREGERVLGRVGWSAARPRQGPGTIVFVANGVIVETVTDRALSPGFLALVAADDLERDLSQTKLQRDAGFRRRIETVHELHALASPAPTFGALDGESFQNRLAMIGGLAGAVIGALTIVNGIVMPFIIEEAGFGFGVFIGAVGLAMLVVGNSMLEKVRRRRRVRREGLPFIATIDSVNAVKSGSFEGKSDVKLFVRIDGRPGRSSTHLATIQTVADGEHGFASGDTIHVRVDRDDVDYVVLDVGSTRTFARSS